MENLKGFHLEQLRAKNLASLTTQCLVLLILQTGKIIGINESDYEGIKEVFLLGLKYNIIDGDVL